MALFSVLLFGYEVPRDPGWQWRCRPGDLVAIRSLDHAWTPRERARFLPVICDLDPAWAEGLVEPYYDTGSYRTYSPPTQEEFEAELSAATGTILTVLDAEARYNEHLEALREDSRWPRTFCFKRRFRILPDTLALRGVDLARMLDPDQVYDPRPEVGIEDVLDKLDLRAADPALDGFHRIRPLTEDEMTALAEA